MHIRPATAQDRAAWEAFVAQHPQGLLGHQFAFWEFYPQAMGLRPDYWLAESGGEVVGIAPLVMRSHLGLGRRLTSLPYLNTGGLLCRDEGVAAALWTQVSEWARGQRVDSIELRNRYTPLPTFPLRAGRSASIIPLPDSEAAAWAQLRSTARNRIRKAQAAGLQVHLGFAHLSEFEAAYAENMQHLGAPILPRRFFMGLAEHLQLGPASELITLRHQGRTLAGMVLMAFRDGAENGWTASTLVGRELYCNDLLYWEAIRWSLGRGLKWLDLGRSEAGGSHEKFKEKFGAQSLALPYQELARRGKTWEGVAQEPAGLYRAFSAVWRRLPPPIAKALGPYVSRQVY